MRCPYRKLEISLQAYILNNLTHISIAFDYGVSNLQQLFLIFALSNILCESSMYIYLRNYDIYIFSTKR